jgi:hypothetical protein
MGGMFSTLDEKPGKFAHESFVFGQIVFEENPYFSCAEDLENLKEIFYENPSQIQHFISNLGPELKEASDLYLEKLDQ